MAFIVGLPANEIVLLVLLMVKKETGSIKWTIVSFLLPTAVAFVVCFITASIYRLIF